MCREDGRVGRPSGVEALMQTVWLAEVWNSMLGARMPGTCLRCSGVTDTRQLASFLTPISPASAHRPTGPFVHDCAPEAQWRRLERRQGRRQHLERRGRARLNRRWRWPGVAGQRDAARCTRLPVSRTGGTCGGCASKRGLALPR